MPTGKKCHKFNSKMLLPSYRYSWTGNDVKLIEPNGISHISTFIGRILFWPQGKLQIFSAWNIILQLVNEKQIHVSTQVTLPTNQSPQSHCLGNKTNPPKKKKKKWLWPLHGFKHSVWLIYYCIDFHSFKNMKLEKMSLLYLQNSLLQWYLK